MGGACLAFDYGTKRIGVAVGNLNTRHTQALDTVAVRGKGPDWEHITRLIQDWQPRALVVGLPLNMDDSDNELTVLARKFGNQLRGRYNLPVHMVDERLTSKAAQSTLREAGLSRQQTLDAIDQVAAEYILQTYFNQPDHAHDEANS